MPSGSVPRALALLVALASHQPCPLAMQQTMHHGLHHGPMSLAWSPLQSHSPLPILPPQPSRLLLASVMHMPPPTVPSLHLRTTPTNTPYPPSPLRTLPSLSLLRLVSANPMRKSASRPSLSCSLPVGWQWLDGFDAATPAHCAGIISQSHQGVMFAFNDVPTIGHGAMLPASFVNAVQLRVRLPLSLLAGITA